MILRPLYCDQLTLNLASLKETNPREDVILFAEVLEEASFKRHKKKLILQFSAMRHFAQELREKGYQVTYVSLNDPQNSGAFRTEIQRFVKKLSPLSVRVTKPGEYRQFQDMLNLQKVLEIPLEIEEDNRFFISSNEFSKWTKTQKNLLMENFYHMVRNKTGLLMNGESPVQNRWNLDKENRKILPKEYKGLSPLKFESDEITNEVSRLVEEKFSNHFGTTENFLFAVKAQDAKKAFNYFLKNHLRYFGDYQDSMKSGEPFLFHSVISPYLNTGLLDAKEVCRDVENAYYTGKVPLNAAEGFIRQILGWREFIRGIYWTYMPSYAQSNSLQHTRRLPDFYWSADTKMNCVHQVVKMTKEEAYSHHIQRLMVTGNFALLAEINPQEVHEWYLAVYADAYEWVELPNTIGMALYADGGVIGTKPYISSGAYINKMSNFCKNCHYSVKEKLGDRACPFNYLYWNFIIKHESWLKKNPRMKFVYSNLEKMDKATHKKITLEANNFFGSLKYDYE
ncbi:MAG: cryptochrome/photolyase family protein [Alphaproteobacteria bacterium]|nr:cryptochrome/photolyase family protein [Alphaproteobacteria bacterium]